jgi:hypothetical protein
MKASSRGRFSATICRFRPAIRSRWRRARAVAGQPVRLGDAADRDGPLAAVAGGRQAVRGVVLELAVDLVAAQDEPVGGGQVDHPLEGRGVHLRARRVVRGVDVQQPRGGPDQPLQGVQVVRPAVLVAAAPLADLGAGAARDLERGLVAGRLHDRVVAGPEEAVVEGEDGLLGGVQHLDVVRADPLVQGRDRLAQPGCARGLGVAAPVLQQALLGAGLQGEEVADGPRLAVAAGEHVPGGELVARVVPLDLERTELHALSLSSR